MFNHVMNRLRDPQMEDLLIDCAIIGWIAMVVTPWL